MMFTSISSKAQSNGKTEEWVIEQILNCNKKENERDIIFRFIKNQETFVKDRNYFF